MMYLLVDKNRIKLLYLKKTLLSQYESLYFEKTHQVDLLKDGTILNTDLLASAVKEAVTAISSSPIKEKEVYLILPQEAFHFFRSEVPKDIAPSAIDSFVADKARALIPIESDSLMADYILVDNEKDKQILYYAVESDLIKKYFELFNLINLQVAAIIPETLAYFKLFEKTLRKEKTEFILYTIIEKLRLSGYLYDSYGPLDQKKAIDEVITETESVEKILKEKAHEYEKQGKKINRIILSGQNSENIRQDTFTKNVGVWTNPLKRILPDFYQDYLKLLISDPNKPIPFLEYDVCIGAFIFSIENKKFSFFKKGFNKMKMPKFTPPQINLPIKDILIFVLSFIFSFLVWIVLSKYNFDVLSFLPKQQLQPTTTPIPATPISPSPTATPVLAKIDKKTIRIKVLNGSGIAGKAADVKEVLTAKGYQEILTANADEFDHEVTLIQIDKSASDSAAIIKADLKDNVTSPEITELTDDSSADIVIIVGTDFK